MKTPNRPQLTPYQMGEQLKILEITAPAQAQMPLHYATSDAVVMVQKGKAVLQIDGQEHILVVGTCLLIPAQKLHALQIVEDFHAFAVMTQQASIEFD
ncbi:MAG: cupin domain-containing protein [Flavobacteriaceae bacterium]|nr:cupin domain-containing protein [Flavobacteriaceae bacterium]